MKQTSVVLYNDHSHSTILDDIKSNEVFLTAVNPDSSTNSTRYSLNVSHHSDEAIVMYQ